MPKDLPHIPHQNNLKDLFANLPTYHPQSTYLYVDKNGKPLKVLSIENGVCKLDIEAN